MLRVDGLAKCYAADGPGVHDVSFDVAPGEFFTLLGPSGCGKTTTLRCIAGLETPDRGSIAIAGQEVFGRTARVPVNDRDIAMVFQSYAIWPHMTVAQNVAFPLEAQGVARSERNRRVEQALAMVGLEGLGGRSASLLSGGQQQRVALARAAVRGAMLLLLDEPLSNLDASLRERMRGELRDLQQRLGTTAIYVTHDQEEAMSLSDRVALMQDGRIVELAAPATLYLRPRHPFTARFLGLAELLPCTLLGRQGDAANVDTALGPLVAHGLPDSLDGRLSLLIRPEHIRFGEGAGANRLQGVVRRAAFAGPHLDYIVTVDGHDLPVQAPSGTMHAVGAQVSLTLPPEHCILVREDGP